MTTAITTTATPCLVRTTLIRPLQRACVQMSWELRRRQKRTSTCTLLDLFRRWGIWPRARQP
jgi:hypothetical protein